MPRMAFLVVWALGVVIAIFLSNNEFNNVDFKAFFFKKIVTNTDLI